MSTNNDSENSRFTKDQKAIPHPNGNGNSAGKEETGRSSSIGEGGNYWQLRYERLSDDYVQLQKINQNLEEKLLNIVEDFERKKEELVNNVEYEKSTLMADVNKLSTKLVDARIKLHDYEEKELMHASECSSPCHKICQPVSKVEETKDQNIMQHDPNLV